MTREDELSCSGSPAAQLSNAPGFGTAAHIYYDMSALFPLVWDGVHIFSFILLFNIFGVSPRVVMCVEDSNMSRASGRCGVEGENREAIFL